jgi:hypothetical protein
VENSLVEQAPMAVMLHQTATSLSGCVSRMNPISNCSNVAEHPEVVASTQKYLAENNITARHSVVSNLV